MVHKDVTVMTLEENQNLTNVQKLNVSPEVHRAYK